MHIISRKRLNDFSSKYPETQNALARWYEIAKENNFISFDNLRQFFPSADRVGKLTVFNIGGNKIFIRAVLTHQEYDRGNWKEQKVEFI